DRPVVDVVVDQLVFGVCAAVCYLNSEIDLVVGMSIRTKDTWKLAMGNATQVGRYFDQYRWTLVVSVGAHVNRDCDFSGRWANSKR
ncbi:MAG: hypothetical protein Q9180_009833, partial [Flavoplaca navasiana]